MSLKKLKGIIENIIARMNAKPDPCCLGNIISRIDEASELAEQLGYKKPPLVHDTEKHTIIAYDPAGGAGSASALDPMGNLLSKNGKAKIIEHLQQWVRELDIHGESTTPKQDRPTLLVRPRDWIKTNNELHMLRAHEKLVERIEQVTLGQAQGNDDGLSLKEAAELFADLTDTTFNKGRISTEIKNGKLAVNANSRPTEATVVRRAIEILKKRKPQHLKKPTQRGGNHTCPKCGEKTHRLVGADKVCKPCLMKEYS